MRGRIDGQIYGRTPKNATFAAILMCATYVRYEPPYAVDA
jgi:hypothetical protein